MAELEAVRNEYRRKLLQHKELDSKLRTLRENVKVAREEFEKTEDDRKALQSEGQIIGEVLRQLDSECLIVKASSGTRYVVGCPNKDDRDKLAAGTRVALDMTTLTIICSPHLPAAIEEARTIKHDKEILKEIKAMTEVRAMMKPHNNAMSMSK